MSCRHSPGDPACSSSPQYAAARAQERVDAEKAKLAKREKELADATPDPDRYEVIDVEQVGNCIVLCARYTSCPKCEYEGKKIMVFEGVTLKDVVRWKRIDPHFRDPSKNKEREAPSPIARFPGTNEGWADALSYAGSRSKP